MESLFTLVVLLAAIAVAATFDDRADGPYSEFTACKLCTESCHLKGHERGGFVEVVNDTNLCRCQGEATAEGRAVYEMKQKKEIESFPNSQKEMVVDDSGNGVVSRETNQVFILDDYDTPTNHTYDHRPNRIQKSDGQDQDHQTPTALPDHPDVAASKTNDYNGESASSADGNYEKKGGSYSENGGGDVFRNENYAENLEGGKNNEAYVESGVVAGENGVEDVGSDVVESGNDVHNGANERENCYCSVKDDRNKVKSGDNFGNIDFSYKQNSKSANGVGYDRSYPQSAGSISRKNPIQHFRYKVEPSDNSIYQWWWQQPSVQRQYPLVPRRSFRQNNGNEFDAYIEYETDTRYGGNKQFKNKYNNGYDAGTAYGADGNIRGNHGYGYYAGNRYGSDYLGYNGYFPDNRFVRNWYSQPQSGENGPVGENVLWQFAPYQQMKINRLWPQNYDFIN